ncbi:cytoskeleton-associated protein 2 [Rhineura floridana]|uniref:cytoskeleton-associated protein 2 n=1 Tax=Rhineura floridana TaxID=261503 RepID=UPI002AC883FB|nr:cytoskeleton-associated protein 2 [Rhineura floridana]XP_061478369.1 cytoskeleton-associated protein 2 [Rhineura floridana]
MEDKENAIGATWSEVDYMVGKNLASPKALQSPIIQKQITMATNCSPLANTKGNCSPLTSTEANYSSLATTAAVSEPAETKNQHILFRQTLNERKTKEKLLKTNAPPNFVAPLSEKRVLGSYRGRIVQSKINSFRKISENEGRKNSLAAPPKSAARAGSTSNVTDVRDDRITSTVNASKSVVTTKSVAISSLQTRPPVRVPVGHPKPILNHEKISISSTSVNKGASQRKPDRTGKLSSTNSSVHGANKNAPPKTGLGPPRTLTRLVPDPCCAVSASKSADDRKNSRAEPAEVKRNRLAEWQASKGIKTLPAPLSADTHSERESLQQTIKEPVESFWAAIAEEDEQRLLSDRVNKILAECLCLIEKGYPGDTVHSTLENLILTVPDAKRFAKYWVCQMRLEQFRSIEKVLAIYEQAILAGAHPKDELRCTLADVMKSTKTVPKSEECANKEIALNHEEEVNLEQEKTENTFKGVLNKKESSNEETSENATKACLKLEQESFADEKKGRNKEQRPTVLKKEEQDGGNANRDGILEFKTPETDKVGSYVIKYNLSTTPYLESTKKKLHCEANDSAVKDLKFLTPVRRSCRIQEKVCKLPDMLKDHNPCVSSFEQLGELGAEGIGFIYRENSALQEVCLHQKGQN